ncbi:MAG: cyclopropane fatty acyl phospholipid synthase [Helicobacter sp.]|nr:cyclopropane fatty acyl phospholipid synthase [Helicobacter sp.]
MIAQSSSWYKIAQDMLGVAGITINGDKPEDIRITNDAFYKRVLQEGSLGLGESYMDGWWKCDRLDLFFYKILRANIESNLPFNLKDMVRIAGARIFNLQSKKRAWIVGKEHYDLGNDLFTRMLDPYMQYSCGYFKDTSDLNEAQEHKLELICRKLKLEPGMKVLDIGCGWGGLCAYMAKNYGVSAVGVTISEKQYNLAKERVKDLDVNILLTDYRELKGNYDRVISVGMFEHVGVKNYNTFFSVVNNTLAENGSFLLHTIGSKKSGNNVDPWINKYIFPNGALPSVRQIASATEPYFVMEDWHNFGADYDKTLMAWHERFMATYPEISQNYSERFKRMFSYYLQACAGAFRARSIQLWQVVFSRGIEEGLRVAR